MSDTLGLRMPEINLVYISGRLTVKPDIRDAGGSKVAHIRVASNRRIKGRNGEWRDETCFFNVNAWREHAEYCAKLDVGSPVIIEGRLISRDYETKDGQKRSTLEVDARHIQLIRSLKAAEKEGSETAEKVDATDSMLI